MWCSNPQYKEIVKNAWRSINEGSDLLSINRKLRAIKLKLKVLNRDVFYDIRGRVREAEGLMHSAQICALKSPSDENFALATAASKNWNEIREAEELFLCQKAREVWFSCGDQNSQYFHRSIKVRQARNFISILNRADGSICDSIKTIAEEAVSYYKGLLGACDLGVLSQTQEYFNDLIDGKISDRDATSLVVPVTGDEIRRSMFSLHSGKSPAPDGFSSHFFKYDWEVIGPDIITGVQEFFCSGTMPPQVNSTNITLVPKVHNAVEMKNFRPISCCNIIYKCITKIMANRLSIILPKIISSSQSAFVKGRLIRDNVLMAHELVSSYHKAQTSPRCVLKVDITKAFDSIHWDYLLLIRAAMNIPSQFIEWISVCLQTTMFSVLINGSPFGYFSAKRGVRQGDPLSPSLFVMVMECLHCLLRRAGDAGLLTYHPRCKKLQIHHLCFADDLLLFSNGSLSGLKAIMDILESFYLLTGLKVNPSKSEIFYSASVPASLRNDMMSLTGFNIGVLPVKYLGIPLISGKLKSEDCKILVDKITARVSSWKAKSSSYAGKLQLVNSVINAMCSYWLNIFLLPKNVIKNVEQICSRFLWGTNDKGHSKAKVYWGSVTLPHREGGLGIRDLNSCNVACLARHIRAILMNSGSVWVAWVRMYRVKSQELWTCKPATNASWVWKRILKVRPMIIPYVTYSLDGQLNWDAVPWLKFCTSEVWKVIRPSEPEVSWYEQVWGAPSIPRYTFICWLAARNRMSTKQKLLQWGIGTDDCCILCDQQEVETRNHLFAGCAYAKQVKLHCRFTDEYMGRLGNLYGPPHFIVQ
ncbi:LINE-1 retrotransposable element ORF2 protein [Linum perenne]